MTFDFRISRARLLRSSGTAEVSTTVVVVTFSGVPIVGGIVIWGRIGWILFVTKTPLTSEVIKLDLPVPSSPQTQIRTWGCQYRLERLVGRVLYLTGGHLCRQTQILFTMIGSSQPEDPGVEDASRDAIMIRGVAVDSGCQEWIPRSPAISCKPCCRPLQQDCNSLDALLAGNIWIGLLSVCCSVSYAMDSVCTPRI